MKFSPAVLFLFVLTNFSPALSFAEEEGGFAAFIKEKEKKAEAKSEIDSEKTSNSNEEPENDPSGQEKAKSKPKKKAEAKEKKKKSNKKEAVAIEEPTKKPVANVEAAAPAPTNPVTTALPERALASPPSNMSNSQTENLSNLILKSSKQCLVVELATLPNGELSCTEPAPLRYTKRDCSSSAVLEIGETEAQVSCADKKKIDLRFRTSTDSLLVSLRGKRQSAGRAGNATTYVVESVTEEEGSIVKLLAAPKLMSISGETPEESPLKLKFSGYAALEWERTAHFGFDGASAQRNFDSKARQATQNGFNFFTNFGFEASRDHTSLVSLFEIGEVYFGDTATGGGVGARATNIFEVRNLYLSHGFSEKIGFRGGIVSTASDPRAFIFSDHLATAQATYKTDLSEGMIWYGDASKNRVAAAHKRDQYFGALGTLGFLTGLKATVFGLSRQKDTEDLLSNDGTNTVLVGDSHFTWLGTTLEGELLTGMTAQATAIGNWVKTKFAGGEDDFKGHLLDVKLSQAWGSSGISTTVEGLMTSGAKNVTDATTNKQIRGKRANFVSPVAASYLMSIATSDGVDDSPGTPKESIIANLNLDEGLKILVLGVNGSITRKASGFFRYGFLQARHGSVATGKTNIGQEADLGLVYQLTPSTSLQFDYGWFAPGDFYSTRASATLAATKMKFSF